jgi:Holliday junction DNA helicase RuvA
MITAITGALNRVLDEEVRLQSGPFEYAVLVPEFVRRQLQTRLGEELTLHTLQYLEGNQMSNRWVPRLVGFLSDDDLEFFDLLCTVDKVGVKKALKALARPPREVADAIQREDVKWISTLPGFGKTTAETVVTSLRRKVTKFALSPAGVNGAAAHPPAAAGTVIEDAYRALLSVGHNPADARARLDAVLAGGKTFESVEALLTAIYSHKG